MWSSRYCLCVDAYWQTMSLCATNIYRSVAFDCTQNESSVSIATCMFVLSLNMIMEIPSNYSSRCMVSLAIVDVDLTQCCGCALLYVDVAVCYVNYVRTCFRTWR